jgi:hypothetical protein
LIANAQVMAQAGAIGLCAEERIGTGFNHKAVAAFGLNYAAEPAGFLKQCPLQVYAGAPGFFQEESRAQSRNASADDSYLLHASETIPEANASRVDASLASAAMKVADVFSDSGRHIFSPYSTST